MLSANLQDVNRFLPIQLNEAQTQQVEALIEVYTIVLNAEYGDYITPANQPVFLLFMAKAIMREITNPNSQILQESVEGIWSVTYAAASTKGDLFLPAEITQLDSLIRKPSFGVVRFSSAKILDQ